MLRRIAQTQTVVVLHRMSTGWWRYEGRQYVVQRPDNGCPARAWTVGCPVCRKSLKFRVNSVAATDRTQAGLGFAGLLCLILAALAYVIVIFFDEDVVGLNYGNSKFIEFLAGLVFFVLGFGLLGARGSYIGFRGHFTGSPAQTEHKIELPKQ